MNELQQKIMGIVEANGNSTDYQTVVDGLDYPGKQRAFENLRAMQTDGLIERSVAIDPVTKRGVVTISKVGA